MNDLNEVFITLKRELLAYHPPLNPKVDSDLAYDLWSFKDLVIEGRKRKEIYFAGLMMHKEYVGFYYMPVYAEPEIKAFFQPELLRLLKGKSCFHIKHLDDELLEQVREALAQGFKQYQQRGWV